MPSNNRYFAKVDSHFIASSVNSHKRKYPGSDQGQYFSVGGEPLIISSGLSESMGINNPRHTLSVSGVLRAVPDVGGVAVSYEVTSLVTQWLVVPSTLTFCAVLVAPASITPLINSPPMVTLATTDDFSMRSSGHSGRSGIRSGISYVPQSSSIRSMNSSGFVSPSYLADHLRTRSIAMLLDINTGVARLGLVVRDPVSATVNVVRGVYLVSSSSRRSIVSLLGLVEPASTPSAFRISSTVFNASRPTSAQAARCIITSRENNNPTVFNIKT
uniref:Uncharacterized protein n=1 Tax=Glossina pallidipes TaxID=7398 RepID=A0A1B0A0L8_GLOPL